MNEAGFAASHPASKLARIHLVDAHRPINSGPLRGKIHGRTGSKHQSRANSVVDLCCSLAKPALFGTLVRCNYYQRVRK